jgi:hypothetical protein
VNVGHVYVVNTTLARPAKDKLTICICAGDNLFFWINTDPRPHGVGQFALAADDHAALTRDCHLDCSRATTFLPNELRDAKHRGAISSDLAARIVQHLTDHAPKTLTPRYLKLAIDNLATLIVE